MVAIDNPVIELVKVPVPDPLVVVLFAVVGFGEVFQQTPLAVTADPPSEVIFPPLVAEFVVIDEAASVERVGTVAVVVKLIWLPYDVPTLLVA